MSCIAIGLPEIHLPQIPGLPIPGLNLALPNLDFPNVPCCNLSIISLPFSLSIPLGSLLNLLPTDAIATIIQVVNAFFAIIQIFINILNSLTISCPLN